MKSSGLKDNALLLITGALCALAACFFWSYFKSAGFDILYIVTIVALIFENQKLRKELKATAQHDHE